MKSVMSQVKCNFRYKTNDNMEMEVSHQPYILVYYSVWNQVFDPVYINVHIEVWGAVYEIS